MTSLSEIYDDACIKLEGRLSQYRYLHSLSVSDVAVMMAQDFAVDPMYARVAGLLHDWDKCYSDEELIERALAFKIDLADDPQILAPLLHAQTGAVAVAREYPDLPQEIVQAVARHTSAALDMTKLDMIIYVADLVEPLRTGPNIQYYRSLADNSTLEELFCKCYQSTLYHLIRRRRYLHPDSVKIWNVYGADPAPRQRGG